MALLSPYKLFFLPCQDDDHYFVDVVKKHGTLIEGRVILVDNKVYIAGVGGRSPLVNIQSIRNKLGKLKAQHLLLATCYPPKRLLDQQVVGVPRGLYELRELIDYLRQLENIDKKTILIGRNCIQERVTLPGDIEVYCCK